MTTLYEPQSPLTFSILEALVKRVGYTLSTIPHMTIDGYYACEAFIWNPKANDEPTLTICSNNRQIPKVFIYWNGELGDKFFIESNLPWPAESHLSLFVELEAKVYSVLAELSTYNADVIELNIDPEKYGTMANFPKLDDK